MLLFILVINLVSNFVKFGIIFLGFLLLVERIKVWSNDGLKVIRRGLKMVLRGDGKCVFDSRVIYVID